MRASLLSSLLAASCLALAPLPAAAHDGGHITFHFRSHGFGRAGFPFNNNAFAFNNGVGFHRSGFPFNNNAFAFNNGVGFGRHHGEFSMSTLADGGILGVVPYTVDAGQSGGQAPTIMIVTAAPPAPPPPPADERPSIETTPQGVTIIRGPGSLHLAR